LDIEDFNRIGHRTPQICDLRPSGGFVMTDLHRNGGIPVVLRRLLDAGLIEGDVMTVTGNTMAENLESLDLSDPDESVVRPIDDPVYEHGAIVILTGSLAPNGTGGLRATAARREVWSTISR
ncbi:hypothetical protein BRC97_11805, partial [Halobacteriales archaeon QS_6_71_20]